MVIELSLISVVAMLVIAAISGASALFVIAAVALAGENER